MEIIMLILSIITFILTLVSLYATSLLFTRNSVGEDAPQLPPGRTRWSNIGETLDFVRFGWRGNAKKFTMDRMKKFSNEVFRTSLVNENMVVFCGAAGNKFLFTNSKVFGSVWLPNGLNKLLVSPENRHRINDEVDYQLDFRTMTTEFMGPENLKKRLIHVIDQMAKQLLETHRTSQQVLVVDLAYKFTFHLACSAFLSLEDLELVNKLEGLFRYIKEGIVAIPLNFPGTTYYRALKASNALREEIIPMVKQRKLQVLSSRTCSDSQIAYNDLLSRILELPPGQEGELFPRDSKIFDMILGCLTAGNTANSAIDCIVKYLTELPEVYAQVLQEQMEIAKNKKPGELLNWADIQKMKYTWCVAQETMRLTPPLQGSFRKVTQEFQYAGYTIPKGWKALWTTHSTNRNPKYFENPDEFDPTRFEGTGPPPFAFVPFGGGLHICPGLQFAKIQMLAFVHNLITQFHFEKILPNEKLTYSVGAVPVNGLPIRLHPRGDHIIDATAQQCY